MNNPLEYFEDLLESDQSEKKKQFMISDFLEKWGNYGDVSVDRENGVIEQAIQSYDENTKSWDSDKGIITFDNSFQQEIYEEYKKAITLISENVLEISSKSYNPELYIKQIENKLKHLKDKSEQFYPNYPFIKETIIELYKYLEEYFSKNANEKINSLQQRDDRISTVLNINNYSPLSFKWDLLNPDDVECELSRLYNLLIAAPELIECDKDDFINGFSQREVLEGIKWKVMSKNKSCSKSSLIYFLLQLIDKCDLMDEPDDFNKKVEYVFRDNLGQKLNNVKQSKSQLSDNPTQKDRIDEIIESFLQG